MLRALLADRFKLAFHTMVDQTGLKGGYDFTIRWTGRGVFDKNKEGISFFEALEKQLGLKLEEKKAPLPVMAIDSVNETPTPNAPGVKENLLVEATEFEVAVIEKSAPGTQPGGSPGAGSTFKPFRSRIFCRLSLMSMPR
jgi:hypothetical protein